MPNHYIVLATKIQFPGRVIVPSEIWKTLSERETWYFTPAAPHRHRIETGDRFLFYLGSKQGGGQFVGHGLASSGVEPLTTADKVFLDSWGIRIFSSRLSFEFVRPLQSGVSIKPLVEDLEFIKDKRNYGLHLRLGVIKVNEKDFNFVLSQV